MQAIVLCGVCDRFHLGSCAGPLCHLPQAPQQLGPQRLPSDAAAPEGVCRRRILEVAHRLCLRSERGDTLERLPGPPRRAGRWALWVPRPRTRAIAALRGHRRQAARNSPPKPSIDLICGMGTPDTDVCHHTVSALSQDRSSLTGASLAFAPRVDGSTMRRSVDFIAAEAGTPWVVQPMDFVGKPRAGAHLGR